MLFKSNSWNNMAFTPDYSMAFIWDYYTNIEVINMTTWQFIQTITLPSTPTIQDSTQMITFSQDSSLAIIESDTYNPIIITNLTTFTT